MLVQRTWMPTKLNGYYYKRSHVIESRGEVLYATLHVTLNVLTKCRGDVPQLVQEFYVFQEEATVPHKMHHVRKDGHSLADRVLFLGCPNNFAVDASRLHCEGGCAYFIYTQINPFLLVSVGRAKGPVASSSSMAAVLTDASRLHVPGLSSYVPGGRDVARRLHRPTTSTVFPFCSACKQHAPYPISAGAIVVDAYRAKSWRKVFTDAFYKCVFPAFSWSQGRLVMQIQVGGSQ
ncbi:hypothetical protein QYE76_045255 [Lolium multiflorum]|uniref:KIB1-4 beta-propeller domain-containing protein n=1 Tax=Lolium multiflorum TaxID=4521 RepID=A0AAD8WXB3_LOLMU|nr:hypothetical protein QYE76_045255 [Lolium multiflorum]